MASSNRGGFDVVIQKPDSTEYDFGLGTKLMMMGNHGTTLDFTSAADSNYSSFRSWEGKMFTASQREELERQTMIYKYMVASIPVPSELLIPISSRYSSNDHVSVGGKGALDQEPWRCRRTDGKKWRCARDAAPDQKYCERHSHKTRPSRSRKLVESSSSASVSVSNPARRVNNTSKVVSSPTSSAVSTANFNNNNPSFETGPAMFMSQQQQYSNSRYPYWITKREAHHAQDVANAPTLSPFFGMDQMTSSTTNDFMGTNDQPLPRQFLDAWSIGNKSDDSSLLTLSMAGGRAREETEERDAQLGMGMYEPEGGADTSNDWMCSSTPGGPLAEALWADVTESGTATGGSEGSGFMK